jgi:WhiB family redox-sensing transcriptional regulator
MIKSTVYSLDSGELDKAACKDMDVNEFFPEGPINRKKVAELKAVCATCPIINECLTVALHNNEYGIWGGTTEFERKNIKRKMKLISIPLK